MAWDDGAEEDYDSDEYATPRLSSTPLIKVYCYLDDNDTLEAIYRPRLVYDSDSQLLVESDQPMRPSPACKYFAAEVVDEEGPWRALVDFQKIGTSNNLYYARLPLLSHWKRIQRRRAFRVQADVEVLITPFRDGVSREQIPGKIKDISATGVGIEIGPEVVVVLGETFHLRCTLPQGPISADVVVANVRGPIVGCEILSVSAQHSRLIGAYIFSQQVRRPDDDLDDD